MLTVYTNYPHEILRINTNYKIWRGGGGQTTLKSISTSAEQDSSKNNWNHSPSFLTLLKREGAKHLIYNLNFRFSHDKYPAGTFFRTNRCSAAPGHFPLERPQKRVSSLSNWIYRSLLVNGKYPLSLKLPVEKRKKLYLLGHGVGIL